MADIGRLNKRVTFFTKDKPNNSTEVTLTELKTVWASVEPGTGKENFGSDKATNDQGWNVYTRYNEALEDVKLEIHYKNKVFEIMSVAPCSSDPNLLKFVCTESKRLRLTPSRKA